MLVIIIMLGLVLGSFINALVWRLRNKRDWVRERSECTHCHHTLSAQDLIPVVSWVMLGGKCRYCHKKIEDSPLTELGLAVVFGVSYAMWPYDIIRPIEIVLFGVWLLILCIFAVLTVYDFKWSVLPDKINYSVFPAAVLFALLRASADSQYSIVAAAIGAITCFGIFYALFQISSGKWIGGGDVKLAFALGLLAGSFVSALLVIFLSSLLGTIYAAPLIIKSKKLRNIRVPYGPFLMGATVLTVLFYEQFHRHFLSPLFLPF